MTLALKFLCRVVQRRVEQGEVLEDVLAEYSKLTVQEREQLKAAL